MSECLLNKHYLIVGSEANDLKNNENHEPL